MLSRTADHLYWMARYTERAENLARIADVTNRMSLMPQSDSDLEMAWRATLKIIGLEEPYLARFERITPDSVLRYLVFDRENPASIYNCLRAARENAHAVRGTLTSELWETANTTWLEMRAKDPDSVGPDGMSPFFEWVKYRSHVSRGVTIGTMLQDESLRFIRLGTFLERADSTARFLDVKYQMLEDRDAPPDEAADYYQWSALLRSVSAFETFRRVYRDQITPIRVAELLILREDMPRSLHRCLKEVHANLSAVSNARSRETERRAGELHASLKYGRIEDVFEIGVHEYLTRFLDRIYDLSNRINEDFLVPTLA